MGLDLRATRFLIEGHRAGIRLGNVLTLGRQYVTVGPERLVAVLKRNGCWPPVEGEEQFLAALRQTPFRFEVFAKLLGATKVTAMDASSYENADVIHDLNQQFIPTKDFIPCFANLNSSW